MTGTANSEIVISSSTAQHTTAHRSLWFPPPRQQPTIPLWVRASPFILLHVACLAALFTGAPPAALILAGFTYFIRMFGITAGYHRYFAHRTYKTSRVVQYLLAWLGCSCMQRGPLWWAGHHRGHHRHSDTEADPHSPHATSFWWSHVGWIVSSEHEDVPWDAIKDYSQYPELRWLDKHHWVPGLVLAVSCFLFGLWTGVGAWACFVWGFLISTVVLYHAVFTVNSLCHLFGRRRYETRDGSRNNWFVALFTLGEGWHNNHHHYQSSANQGFRWWEIDVSYYIIRMMGWVGLVWDIRTPGAKALAHGGLKTHQPAA